MILELVDGGIQEIYSDMESYGGCETCDWGSEYINEFEVELTTGSLEIRINQMYEYALSEGFMMKLFLQNAEGIKKMTEQEFVDWLERSVRAELEEESWNSPESIEFKFVSN